MELDEHPSFVLREFPVAENPDLGNLQDFFRELDCSIITTAGENQRFPPGMGKFPFALLSKK